MANSGRRYSYEEVDALVKAYQAGDKSAGEELVEAFSGYLTKYLLVIKHGTVEPYNKSMRKFIALFVKNPSERQLVLKVYSKKNKQMLGVLYSTASMISSQFRHYDEEDLWAELVLEFLIMAKKYNNSRGCFFHTYISKAYPYRIYKRLSKLIRDPITISYLAGDSSDIDELEGVRGEYDTYEVYEENRPIFICDNIEINELNENWVSGFTCSDTFIDLTPLERRVIMLYYYNGYRDNEISDMLGFSASKIAKIRSSARKKLMKRRVADACKKQ